MLEFCDRVIAYTTGFDAPALLAEQMRDDATSRNLELIGEAATRVPDEFRGRAPELPWRLLIATRNRLAHGYLGIEPETVWLIATDHVPRLRVQLVAMLEAPT